MSAKKACSFHYAAQEACLVRARMHLLILTSKQTERRCTGRTRGWEVKDVQFDRKIELQSDFCFQYSMNREEKVSLGFVYHTDEESREFLVLEGCPHKMKDTFKK